METPQVLRKKAAVELRSRPLRVLDTDGEVYTVHAGDVEFEDPHRGARQLHFVVSIIDRHRTTNYTAISALHKELRRGDYARAHIWARTIIHFRGIKGLKEYLRSVLWEETRNIQLYQEWRANPGISWEEMLQQFCGATKKYEIEGSKDTFQIQIKAINDAAQLPTIEDGELLHAPKPDNYEFYNWVLLIQRVFERAFREGGGKIRDTRMPRMRGYKILAGTLRRSLEAEGLKAWAEPFSDRTDFDDVMQTSEKLSGLLETPDVCKIRPVKTDLIDADFAMPEDYVFDGHTSRGFGGLRKWARFYRPLPIKGYRKPMVKGLDMRWSGMQSGVAWRYRAFEQFGLGYKDVAWEDVRFTRQEFAEIITADNHWFHYVDDVGDEDSD